MIIHWPDKISNHQLLVYEQTATTTQISELRWPKPLKEKEGEEGQGTTRCVQWRKREKNLGGTVGERRRFLSVTDVSDVFCCTPSCVLRGTERKSKKV